MAIASKSTQRVVVVGAGFGGLNVVKGLLHERVQITIVDRKNHHTFQPLLYQVATAGLSPAEIAAPIRTIFRGDSNVVSLLE
jgi:NADH:ubiquinone reductase (H+-translocating)